MGFYSFYVWMGVNFVLVILVFFFYPETKGVSLEEMDALFGATGKTDAVVQKAHQHAEEIKYSHDEKSSTA